MTAITSHLMLTYRYGIQGTRIGNGDLLLPSPRQALAGIGKGGGPVPLYLVGSYRAV